MVRGSPEDRRRLREHLLVLRCQAGDEEAFSDLYNRFGSRTFRYLEGLLGPDAAADTDQEVWLAVWQRIADLSNPGAFRTWLYQTTRHRAIDVLRREKREAELLRPLEVEEQTVAGDPDDRLVKPEVREALAAGLAGLSARHREVLHLRYWEDMSYAAIALVLGCSVGTVRSRLHHARRSLREALQGREAVGDPGHTNTRNEGVRE